MFFLGVWAANAIRRTMQRAVPATCVVFHYHGIAAKHRADFARQMDVLLRWTTPLAAGNRHPLESSKRYAAVTFDDGFQSAFENALPELVQRNIPATIFVVADLLGSTPRWTTFDGDDVEHELVAPLEQVERLPVDLITVGSHTLSHPWLPSLPEHEAKIELSASRDKLKNLLNRNITLFSFPYGALSDDLINWCQEVGYERVFTISPKLAFSDPKEFVTGRILVDPADWPLEFRLKLLGAYRWLPWAIELKKKLLRSSSYRAVSTNGLH